MLLTTGGVSMGDYDMVKDILARDGKMVFWKVRVKPGKPLAFGKIKGRTKTASPKSIPHLGLPGNATSCMVSFELFVRPALLKMMGKKKLAKPTRGSHHRRHREKRCRTPYLRPGDNRKA